MLNLGRGNTRSRGLRLGRGNALFRAVFFRLGKRDVKVVDLSVVVGHRGSTLRLMMGLAEPDHIALI